MTITAAADGSALGNPGPAGWAWYIDEDTWRAGGWPHGTNNMGELKAVLDLLEATAVDADQHLHILCDSQYVINSITKWMPGWKRKGWRKKDGKPVMNVELLKDIDRALAGRSVEFEWVKGHAGHAMNEAADKRANAAATAFSKKQDPQVGPGYRGSGPAQGGSSPAPSAGSSSTG
ncbi:ribonuclease H family protein, partial [Brachybacterium paraconglomeratum]